MENTNQKNTGNIQIAPVSAAADLNHKREGYLTWDEYFIMVSQKAVPMMNFPGQERESLWIPNICM